ncbi:hypothetical protein [Streptomyces sp. NPDC006668]|uniref:hypothetical protein n=1 Tax=Streptomyces sp. NPDC006668 TaxID=3156903 RepID=UPI0033D790D1
MIPSFCPGRCNNAWRVAEAALAAEGTPHDIPAIWGRPVHCERCATRACAQLAELPELIVAIGLEALHGTGPRAAGVVGRTGRVASPSWPGQAARLMTDHIVGGLLELEDDVRELRGLGMRPGRGTEVQNAVGAVAFLTAHLEWALSEHPAALEAHDRMSANPAAQIAGWHRAAQRFTGRDARVEHYCLPCPRCDLLTLYRGDGEDYIECRNVSCQVLLTASEYQDHSRELAGALNV